MKAERGKSQVMRSWGCAIVGLLTMVCIGGCSNSPKPASNVEVQVLDHAGFEKLLAKHHGQVVVVDCWSTSCEPCKKEFPKLVALHQKYGPDKVACVSLCFDYDGRGKVEGEMLARIRQFLVGQNATFENVVSSTPDTELYQKLDVNSVPTVRVYGPDGKLAQQFETEPVYEKVPALIEKLLSGK